jgi:K+-transporting ATPase ATPase C chain
VLSARETFAISYRHSSWFLYCLNDRRLLFTEVRRSLSIAARLTAVLVLLCGVAYPTLIFAGSHLFFRAAAEGSALYDRCGRAVGSRLIGQRFTRPSYFWGRPSAIEYDARNSGASNLGPLNPALADSLARRAEAFRAANSLPATVSLPADVITASGSGLDPDISPAAARLQIGRVAQARSSAADAWPDAATLGTLVAAYTVNRQIGLLGEPRVNVLALNVALDRMDDSVRKRRPACPSAAGSPSVC